MGVPDTLGSDVPNLMKDASNLMKDVPRVRKCVAKWEWTHNHFVMGF